MAHTTAKIHSTQEIVILKTHRTLSDLGETWNDIKLIRNWWKQVFGKLMFQHIGHLKNWYVSNCFQEIAIKPTNQNY